MHFFMLLKIFEHIGKTYVTTLEFYSKKCRTFENSTAFTSKMAKARLVICLGLSRSRQLLHSFPIPSFHLCHQRSARSGACSRSYLEICCSLVGDPQMRSFMPANRTKRQFVNKEFVVPPSLSSLSFRREKQFAAVLSNANAIRDEEG